MMYHQYDADFSSPVRKQPDRAAVNWPDISPELEALSGLEFRKQFLVLSYLGGQKLEGFLSADYIRRLSEMPMEKFEAEVWNSVGQKCDYIKNFDRIRYVCWDSGKTHIYQCHVYPEGYYRFKGPHLAPTNNLLQRTLGDENVLLVKIAEDTDKRSSKCKVNDCFSKYGWLARKGILVGLRRYRFFVFKDGGKEEKKKDPTTSQVKCYFVRMESHEPTGDSEYILQGKTVREARSVFMNVDSLSILSKYMARFSLILSKTIGLDVDLSCVNIERIDDVVCLDNGNAVKDKDGKDRIHTDGTGFISEDLALKCQNDYLKGKWLNATTVEHFLIQFRLFNNGCAIKGTFLVNKKLPAKTMQVCPSMIKVEPSSTPNGYSKNSMDIVNISLRPKGACLSRTLIALLSYGGVPNEFFLDVLNNSLEEAQNALSSRRADLRVALNHGEMDDLTSVNMILSGIPLEESFLQSNLRTWMDDDKKSLRGGKLPLSESYYVMGTTDPTGLLESDEVCVIWLMVQRRRFLLIPKECVVSKLIVEEVPDVYMELQRGRKMGMSRGMYWFTETLGCIHVLKARYVKELEDYVGEAKYAVFFPCKGPRSLADEIAGGDFDGDMYFVSKNPKLLETFKPSEPWQDTMVSPNVPTKKPSELSNEELEDELFKLYLENRFNPSYTVGIAADSWQAIMDRLLTLGNDRNDERKAMKKTIQQLIDIYYAALDAPKKVRGKIVLPEHLKAEAYPHYMEKSCSYKSTSILGIIYDKVRCFAESNQDKIEVRKLPCFADKSSDSAFTKWKLLYERYRKDMQIACQSKNKDNKNLLAEHVIKKYKEILYEAPDFEESKRGMADIFDEALAIYDVCYAHAMGHGVAKCGFAWRVAGPALCKYYITCQNDHPVTCSPLALKEIFG